MLASVTCGTLSHSGEPMACGRESIDLNLFRLRRVQVSVIRR